MNGCCLIVHRPSGKLKLPFVSFKWIDFGKLGDPIRSSPLVKVFKFSCAFTCRWESPRTATCSFVVCCMFWVTPQQAFSLLPWETIVCGHHASVDWDALGLFWCRRMLILAVVKSDKTSFKHPNRLRRAIKRRVISLFITCLKKIDSFHGFIMIAVLWS